MELKAGCGGTPQRLRRLLAPRRCYCWNIGLPIFSFAPPCRCIAALTAPFICRMQIECNRRCGARLALARLRVELVDRGQTRDATVTQAQLHVCIRSIAVLSPIEKNKSPGISHATPCKLVNFLLRLKETV